MLSRSHCLYALINLLVHSRRAESSRYLSGCCINMSQASCNQAPMFFVLVSRTLKDNVQVLHLITDFSSLLYVFSFSCLDSFSNYTCYLSTFENPIAYTLTPKHSMVQLEIDYQKFPFLGWYMTRFSGELMNSRRRQCFTFGVLPFIFNFS